MAQVVKQVGTYLLTNNKTRYRRRSCACSLSVSGSANHVLNRSAFDAIAASPTTAVVLAGTSSWTPAVGGLISDSSDLMSDVLPFHNVVRQQARTAATCGDMHYMRQGKRACVGEAEHARKC